LTVPFGSAIIEIVEQYFIPNLFSVSFKIDENLGSYFDELSPADKRRMIMEEKNVRENYVSDIYIY
jgi:hypothetical protein